MNTNTRTFLTGLGLAAALWALLGALRPGTAHAAPSILGTSGFFYTPDGMTLPGGCANFHYHYAKGDEKNIVRTGPIPRLVRRRPDVNAVGFGIGIGNRWELGATRVNSGEARFYRALDGSTRMAGGVRWLMNTKISVLQPDLPVHLAVGAIDMLGHMCTTPYTYLGYDASQSQRNLPGMLGRARVGAGWGLGILDGFFVNGALPLLPNLEFMMEWLQRNGLPDVYDGSQLNLGMRLRSRKVAGIAIDVGAINLHQPSIGFSYTYCKKKKKHHGDDEGPSPFFPEPGKGDPFAKPDGKVTPPPAPFPPAPAPMPAPRP